jgi:hypothetical protein
MSGPVEEGAKLANTFMDSLKREPLSLALVVMNLCLLFFFYLILAAVSAQREREVNLMYADKKQISDLLVKCAIPGRAGLFPLPKLQSFDEAFKK